MILWLKDGVPVTRGRLSVVENNHALTGSQKFPKKFIPVQFVENNFFSKFDNPLLTIFRFDVIDFGTYSIIAEDHSGLDQKNMLINSSLCKFQEKFNILYEFSTKNDQLTAFRFTEYLKLNILKSKTPEIISRT